MEKQQAEKKILKVIIREQNSNNRHQKRSFIIPGNIIVERGEEVTWEAGETDLVMFFPNQRLLGIDKIVVRSGLTRTERINEKVEPGIYPYAVYTAETNDFAEGNSSPRMTIK